MPKINSAEIMTQITKIKKSGDEFYINYFLTTLNEELLYFENDGAIVFLQPEHDFYRLYFACSDLEKLDDLLVQLPKDEIYLEYVCKNDIDEKLAEILLRYFTFDALYQKMFKKLNVVDEKYLPVNVIDAKVIYKKVYETFNIYYDHLASEEEIIEMCENRNVITIYEGGQLRAFLIYKIKGKSAYLNHIANYGSKDNLIELWNKFYQTLNAKEINYLDLWYDKANAKALNMYRIEQFSDFNLYNYIYKLKG